MLGKINRTSQSGGIIETAEGWRIPFQWRDCLPSVNPSDVGHSTAVDFDTIDSGGKLRAGAACHTSGHDRIEPNTFPLTVTLGVSEMDGPAEFTGNPNLAALVLQPSQVVTADGTGAAVGNLGCWSTALLQLDCTSAAAAGGDTLDLFVQTTVDATNWVDVLHFTQILGNGGPKRLISKLVNSAAQAEYNNASALAAAGVRHNLGADQYRVRWAVVDGGAHGQSFTFSVTANLQ